MNGRTGKLANLAFSARHIGISVWVLTQTYTSISVPFRENVAAVVFSFYTPATKSIESIFDDFAGELSAEEYKTLIVRLKAQKYAYLLFSLQQWMKKRLVK